MNLGHIAIKKQAMIKFKNNSQAPNPHYIDLASMQTDFNVFNFMPRFFTITTNNSSCKFNTDILIGTSTVISNFIQKNHSNLHYHLNTNDDKNVLSKFEQIYQGESVQFDKSEMRISQLIADELNLFGFNNFDSYSAVHRNFTTSNISSRIQFRIKERKVEIDQSSIRSYLQKNAYYSFNIKTNKHEYRCSIYGALFSSVIREFISNEPNSKIFNFDYEDNEKEFQSICDLFNFKKVLLTSRNVDAIKEMAELLGIDCIFKSIDEFIDENERVSKSIDDQQKIIDSIDYLFDLLYNIKEKTVDFVANFIEDSKWSQTKEDVYELAAFILQVVQTNILLHQYLIELLLKLDKNENDKKNQLNLLLSFVVDYSISLFNKEMTTSNPNLIFPFVYQLYKREIIPKDKLKFKGSNLENQYFVSWFLPELADCNSKFDKIDIKKGEIRICRKNKRDEDFYSNSRFIACDVNDIEEYKIMRDKGEYDDDLARAIRNDDVDHFQSIVSKSDGKFLKNKVKKNIFEPFFNSDMNYLNYAAAYGSIKCFKYLHLNHQKVDQLTFEMAIIGGNIEIIRIVDNEKFDESVKNNFSINAKRFGLNYENNPLKVLIQSIKYHKNDLFDWILEQKFSKINQNENLLSLIENSLINGNIHSFVQLVDTGFDIHNYSKKYNQFMSDVSEKGFYSFADFLQKIIKKEDDNQIISCNPTSAVCFGNIKIFKLFENSMRQSDLYEALILAIKKCYMNIIKYFFETLVNQNFSLNSQYSIEILAHCFANDSKEVLDYLIENINKLHLFNIDSLCLLLDKTTKHQNVEAYKTISELIYQSNPKSDFTSLFFKSSVWNLKDLICHFIDRKYIKNDFDLAEKIIKDGSIDLDIYKLLMNNIDSRNKKRMLNIIDKVIQKRNKPFIKYLLDENAPLDDSLIFGVDTKDLEIVELILERNCEPSYINKITKYGTALFVAVKNNNLPIIKRLLSLPGINPNIYCQSNMTPLILAGSKLKIEAFDALLEFYGDKIKDQKDQLENIIKYIISYYPNGYASKNTKNEMILSINGSHSDLSTILTKIIKLNCIDLNFSIQTNFNDIDHKAQSTTLLFYACRINEISVVEALIESDSIDVNIYDPETGNTPLIESIKIHNINIAKLLIKNPKTKINIRNFAGQSALVEAAQSFRIHKEIFYFLINDEKFNEEESNINYAFFISCNESLFAFKSLNVSYIPLNVPSSCIKNIDYKSIIITPIIRAILRNDNELLDSIVNHPSYVKDVFQLINTIYIIISDFNKVTFDLFSKVFKLLEEYDIDINSPVFSGNCILVEAIKLSNNYEIISKILNYPGFDSQKSNILLAFNLAYNSINGQKDVLKRCMKTKVMDMLYDYDIKHNHLIDLTCQKKDGSSLLLKIYSTIFSESNPNDQIANEFPLKYAIENNLYILSLCLIESNKIDFEKQYLARKNANSSFRKRPQYTYLHTAAALGRTRIIQEILSRHLIDINVVNNLGSTPLMEACKNLQIECVKLLFKYDDLDFLKKDDYERDAIYFVQHLNDTPNSLNLDEKTENPIKDKITNKDEYLSELLKLIEEKKSANIPTVDTFKSNNKITLDDLTNIRNNSSLSMLASHSVNLKLMNQQNEKDSDEEKSLKKILKTDKSDTKVDTDSTTNTATKSDTKIGTDSTTKTVTKIDTYIYSEVTNDELSKYQSSADIIAAENEYNTIKPHNDRYEKILKQMNEKQPITATYEPVISSKKERLYQKFQPNSFNNEFKPSFHNNNNNIIPKKLNHLVFDISNESQISNKDDSIETRKFDFSKMNLNQKNSNLLNSNKEETVKTDTKISKTKFKIYSESFSENPDPNFYQKVQKASEKVEINQNKSQQKFEILSSEIFTNSSEKELIVRPNKLSKFYNRKEEVDDEFLFDDEEQNQLSFDQQQIQNRNQFMLMQVQQQQQQWLQMIQMNNQFQTQMFMQMMNQQNVNQKKHHQSKKKKKGNKK